MSPIAIVSLPTLKMVYTTLKGISGNMDMTKTPPKANDNLKKLVTVMMIIDNTIVGVTGVYATS